MNLRTSVTFAPRSMAYSISIPDFKNFVAHVTEEQPRRVENCLRIDRRPRGLQQDIVRWVDYCFANRADVGAGESTFAQQVTQLFPLFRHLAKKCLAPFSSGAVAYVNEYKKPDWKNVPGELSYLIKLAEDYSVSCCESDIFAFLDRATGTRYGNDWRLSLNWIRVNRHMGIINKWLDAF